MVDYKLFMDQIRDIIGVIWLVAIALMHLKFFIFQLSFFLLLRFDILICCPEVCENVHDSFINVYKIQL